MPALLVVMVVGKMVHDKTVDSIQSDLLFRRVTNGHGDQRNITIRRFLMGRASSISTFQVSMTLSIIGFRSDLKQAEVDLLRDVALRPLR